MKFQIVSRMRSTVEIVELATVKQLRQAVEEASCFQSVAEQALSSQGIKAGSKIVAVKLDSIYIGVCWIGRDGQKASYFPFYDRRAKAIRVLESEFVKRSMIQVIGRAKRCAKRRYALCG
jgi:hypothetical protein